MSRQKPHGWAPGRCEACRKIAYLDRAGARRARRMMGDSGLSVYQCPQGVGWHLGHLSVEIKAGHATRDEIYGAGA